MRYKIIDIYNELKNKITASRLKEISIDIIDRYKENDHDGLLFYAGLLDIDGSHGNTSRLFARIIQVYHPDKIHTVLKEIDLHYKANKIEELIRIKNAFLFAAPERKRGEFRPEDIDEKYSFDAEDFGYAEPDIHYEEETSAEYEDEGSFYAHYESGFIEAVTRLLFGNLDFTLVPGDLQSIEGELDLSDYGIDDLRGAEHCISLNGLNLSGNRIRNISPLAGLVRLESLFLSQNNIESIESLSGLENCKELDISFNEIEDISVLKKLDNLLYVNVMGNPVRDTHIMRELSAQGIIVVY